MESLNNIRNKDNNKLKFIRDTIIPEELEKYSNIQNLFSQINSIDVADIANAISQSFKANEIDLIFMIIDHYLSIYKMYYKEIVQIVKQVLQKLQIKITKQNLYLLPQDIIYSLIHEKYII